MDEVLHGMHRYRRRRAGDVEDALDPQHCSPWRCSSIVSQMPNRVQSTGSSRLSAKCGDIVRVMAMRIGHSRRGNPPAPALDAIAGKQRACIEIVFGGTPAARPD